MTTRSIHASAPVRIADLGGWTDTWFSSSGVVCSLAVQPGASVTMSVTPGSGHVIIDAVNFGHRYSTADERGRHPLLEAAVEEVGVASDVDVVVEVGSSIPPGAATGTSAAVTVALVGALLFLRDGAVDRSDVAETAHRVESIRLGRQTGIQDQLASVHGGANRIDMSSYPSADVTRLPMTPALHDELQRRLLLVFFGRAHVSSAVHAEVIASLEGASAPEVERRLEPLRQAARDGAEALVAGDLDKYGQALVDNTAAQTALHAALVSDEAWHLIGAAHALGCVGWKVNGAGGEGGSVTLLCGSGSSDRSRVVAALNDIDPRLVAIDTTLDGDGLQVWESDRDA